MTITSSSPQIERGLDTMFLVYGALQGHPAAKVCENFLRSHSGWFTSPLVLFEAKSILTKVYGVDPHSASQKLATAPVVVLPLDGPDIAPIFQLADAHALDLTDAVLLHLSQIHGAKYLATEDSRLARTCTQLGIAPISPFDAALRQQIGVWETANLVPKGLARVLRRIHQWMSQSHPQAANDLWSATGGGSHLP